ncbi:unnamed protein product [Brugia pahangi]|uniref:7TM_GPCR_Srx domain-containing protein n=1 Tax=Brugia pahangi TaxID=6280 RepID=A0A0N4T4P4_BRUPA|nr:unnamed protein product [Brugia pahangi]
MVAYYYCIIVLLSILPLKCHAENTTNVFDIRDERSTVERYVAVVLFSLLLLYSIVSNVLLIFEFCRRDNLYNHSFVLITSQLIVCNLSISLLQVLFILPQILQNKDNSNVSNTIWTGGIFSHIDTFLFIATLQFAFLLSVNRFVIINLPKFHGIFESKKLIFLLCCVWLFYHFWTASLPIAVFVIYIAIFCGIRHNWSFSLHNQNKKISRIFTRIEMRTRKINNYEWSTLIQAALTCFFMEIEIIIFNFLPTFAVKIFGEKANIPSRIFVNCCIIFNCAVFPTIHFICNKQARNIWKQKCLFLKNRLEKRWNHCFEWFNA